MKQINYYHLNSPYSVLFKMRSSANLIKQGLFRMQYASNMHLLKYINIKQMIEPVAPYLALVGHCGNSDTIPFLFQYSSKEFEKVFYVPGPNDPPYSWLEQTANQFPNVHLLQRDSHYLEQYNVSIVGTTWWKHTESWARRGYPISGNVRGSYDTQWIQSQVEVHKQNYQDIVLLTYHTFPYSYDPSIKLHIYGDDSQPLLYYKDQTLKAVNPNKVTNAYMEIPMTTIETADKSEILV